MMNFQGLLLEKSRSRLRLLCTPKAAATSDSNNCKNLTTIGFFGGLGCVMSMLLRG